MLRIASKLARTEAPRAGEVDREPVTLVIFTMTSFGLEPLGKFIVAAETCCMIVWL
jgi:hypothetical protein